MTEPAYPIRHENITAVILAGGRARRMEEHDKGLVALNARPMIEYVLDAVSAQVGRVIISANRNLSAYERYGYPVLQDQVGGFAGPLAGIERALATAGSPYLLCVPCDSPTPPSDLASRLIAALAPTPANLAIAHDGQRLQPLFALLRTDCHTGLCEALNRGIRKTRHWMTKQTHIVVDFSDQPQAFDNLNTFEAVERFAYAAV